MCFNLSNILLKNDKIKIGDLGFARHTDVASAITTGMGTLGYISPEMLDCRSTINKKTDIW